MSELADVRRCSHSSQQPVLWQHPDGLGLGVGLVGNGAVLHRVLGRFATGSSLFGDRANYNKSGALRNMGASDQGNWKKSAIPSGYGAGGAWVLPITRGAVASRGDIFSTGNLSASGALGRNLEGNLSGSSDLAASCALVVSAVAILTGSGELSASVVGKLEAVAALAGSGDLTASIQAFASIIAELNGTGELNATASGKGNIDVSISSLGEALTASSVASAVWDALASAINNPNTAGELLNLASLGGAGGGLSPSQAAALQRILDLLEADEKLEPNRARKFARGTTTVLLDKTVTGGNLSGTVDIKE